MLNKEVCKACAASAASRGMTKEERASVHRWSRGDLVPESWSGWSDSDELRWNKGLVICRVSPEIREPHGAIRTIITESPPSWCGFACEHIISEESDREHA
jgi:hypothetical protein